MFKTLLWEDWAGIGLGVWMLASPWLLGYSDNSAATMNALVMGTILVLEETLEAGAHEAVEEWIDVVAGLWLMISPVALGFTSVPSASLNAFAVGVLTVVFAAWAMWPQEKSLRRWWEDIQAGF